MPKSDLRFVIFLKIKCLTVLREIRCAGSHGNMSASGLAGPGFDTQQGGKFSTSGLGGVQMYTF